VAAGGSTIGQCHSKLKACLTLLFHHEYYCFLPNINLGKQIGINLGKYFVAVMAGLVAPGLDPGAIHALLAEAPGRKAWMPGTSPGHDD
jgi:hypothetical protein